MTAYVPTGESGERLTISRDAIMRGPTGAYVYVARQTQPQAPASAVPADVQVLFAAGERFVVQSSMLQAGDMLVVEGNERLFPMAPIIPQAAGIGDKGLGVSSTGEGEPQPATNPGSIANP